jgi:hypothetical protein
LFIIALDTIKELFMQNQMVADAVGAAFEGLALVFNDVFGLLIGGQESVKKLGDAFDKYFGQPIQTATQAFEKFGDAFSKIFGGDFSGALESAKEGFSGLGDAISQTGDGFVEAATDAAEYAVELKDAAVANVQLAKEAQKAEVINAGLLEKYDRQAEQQRQIRDEERNSITDRIAANVELGRILEEQNAKMLENAKIVERAAQVAYNRNKSLENETALIAAKNEVMAVEATIEGFRSEQLANDLALDRERVELINTEKESISNLGFEKRKFDAEQEKRDTIRIEKLKEINAEERVSEQARLQAIVDEANIGTQAKVDAQIALDEFMQTSRQESVTLEKEYTEELAAELQKRKDDELAAFVNKKEIAMATVGVLQNGLGVLKGVTEGNLKLQKAIIVAEAAASIGQIIMSTQVANAKAAVAVPPTGFPFTLINTANAAIGIAATIASSKKALSAIGEGGSIASEATISSPSTRGDSFESQAPEFNIVGTSGANQIADVVSSQAPVKAYVVANDVTTAQALDRNIVESATL